MNSRENLLLKLREREFNVRNENALLEHRYVKDAVAGNLKKEHLCQFVEEQFFIQQSDRKSFELMADNCSNRGKIACASFFKLLADGEKHAQGLLMDMAKWLNVEKKDLESYKCKMKAQAYPSYVARCVLQENPSYLACACAINFPAWGQMCRNIHTALKSGKYGEVEEKDIEFLNFFATPIDGFDEMALKCLEEENITESDVKLDIVVRLLQECEVLFWDSVYE